VRLGFAVKVLGAGGLPSHDTRRWQSGPHLSVSLDRLEAILAYLEDAGIGMYRMATALAPYASHPDLPQFRGQPRECAERLAEVGARARALGVRLSTHPGQYTVLNSEDERVAALAAAELEVQAEIFDGMGLGSEAVVVLHVGGARRVLRADPAAAEHALEEAERVCRDSLDGIRGVVGLLRGPEDSAALSLDLDALAATYRRAGVPVTLTVDGDPAALPLAIRITLYRVLQEALANAGRYAGPGPVSATVAVASGAVTAAVTNPVGSARAEPSRAGGFGLVGLREQVAAQSGELTGGAHDGVWTVACRLPVPTAALPASRS
jgi:two-component sensor histidine kinase